MPRPRVSMAGLLAVVGVAALTFGAMRGASMAWAGAMGSVTFFAMLASLLGIGFGRGGRRVFWTGFAVMGWAYLILSWLPMSLDVRSHLLAPNLFDLLYDRIHPEDAGNERGPTASTSEPGGFRSMGGMGGRASSPGTPDPGSFTRIGEALEALLWAFLGGWTARYFASGPRPAREGTIPPVAG